MHNKFAEVNAVEMMLHFVAQILTRHTVTLETYP